MNAGAGEFMGNSITPKTFNTAMRCDRAQHVDRGAGDARRIGRGHAIPFLRASPESRISRIFFPNEILV